jgi:hypothetical protein
MTEMRRSEGDSAVHVRRIVITSDFVVTHFCATDAFSFRRNLCGSHQELEFLKAVRLYFPSLIAHPNIPLHNFIQEDRVIDFTTDAQRRYFLAAKVDVLLCTQDEDPVAGIELDPKLDDSAASGHVRAEDFYSLLCNRADDLASLRPKRMRPRRSHDVLVPADGHPHPSGMEV